MRPHNQQPQSIGNLFSGTIFGNNVDVDVNAKSKAKTRSNKKTRQDKQIIPALSENDTPVMAVHPFIDSSAFAATMDNYRLYIAHYNELISKLNEENEKYNASVRRFRNENALNEVQISFSRIFLARNSAKKPKEYNQLVQDFNDERGLVLEKKKFQTVKYATEIVFQQILYAYSVQLQKTTSEYIKLGISEATPVRQMEINAHHITNLQRNGVSSISVTNKTIRAHRERLEEAGVFTDYLFRGHKKGLKMNISSQILSVFDAKTQNITIPENQHFSLKKRKECSDNNEVTRTLKRNIKNRENGQADFLGKGTPSAGFSFVFYKNTPKQGKDLQTTGGGENVKIEKTLSEKLESTILPSQVLAENLTIGQYNNYKRLDKRILHKEALHGTMSREDFKTLIIQEFFKNAAKLYRGRTPYLGSWKKAINSYEEKLFTVNNGTISLYNKQLMVDKLDEMIWRINTANKWFLKTKINPLFPSDYFDFTRTEKQEIGFEYTAKSWKNHLKYLENKPKLAKSAVKKSTIRKTQINNSKKFDAKINAFFKNRIELPELIDYVNENLPANYLQALSDRLLKVSTNYNC
ncbi:hypothetical protein [Flavobacterium mesophilum]|uniref:hypothetical protein n=1 Tax=Flavobacterium mesophilum TaxID=3143495 RepID=UPI0031DED554